MSWQPALTAPIDGTPLWFCYDDGHRGANVLLSESNLLDAMLAGMIAWCEKKPGEIEPPAQPYGGMAWK